VVRFLPAEGTFPELVSFISSEVNPFVAKNFGSVFHEGASQFLTFAFAGANLEGPLARTFCEVLTSFGADEALHMSQGVEEGNDAETSGMELGAQTGDLLGGEGAGSCGPGSGGVSESVFQVKAHRVITRVQGSGEHFRQERLLGILFAGYIIRPSDEFHFSIL
jgi:hypothetical protein